MKTFEIRGSWRRLLFKRTLECAGVAIAGFIPARIYQKRSGLPYSWGFWFFLFGCAAAPMFALRLAPALWYAIRRPGTPPQIVRLSERGIVYHHFGERVSRVSWSRITGHFKHLFGSLSIDAESESTVRIEFESFSRGQRQQLLSFLDMQARETTATVGG